ncbi:hypothetical protein [Sulfurimonas sp. C5]|uniref:hypothetical protein n=1 Tax=Sulfurimonas sp. C5 TaxID=3036947 RepID=UPI002455E14D|nr:hypothetical protein [Sulfurimonas sp. C5]MDH4944510.1 hypothetical protein [Sulfurimonas sp. C5]
MKYNNIKELLSVLIFSFLIFANPIVNTLTFDMTNASKIMLDIEMESEEVELEEAEEENEEESKNAFFLSYFSLSNIYSNGAQPTYQIQSHTYRTNASLLKPPIL